jgi:hypothetical protein
MTTTSPGFSHLASRCRTKRRKIFPFTAPWCVISFGFCPIRIAPIIVIVFHDRPGRRPTTRSPTFAQPYSRAIDVLQNDSSRNTRFPAATTVSIADTTMRRMRFSGVSRSVATNFFFFASSRAGVAHASRSRGLFGRRCVQSALPSARRRWHRASSRSAAAADVRRARRWARTAPDHGAVAERCQSHDEGGAPGSRTRLRCRGDRRSARTSARAHGRSE